MTAPCSVTGLQLLCAVARKYGWRVRLESSADYNHVAEGSRPVALEVRYTIGARPLTAAGQMLVDGELIDADVDVALSLARSARRALGPGDDNIDRAVWELVDGLRALGVLVMRVNG